PGKTPSTPACAQFGTDSGGGGSGKRQRYQGPPRWGAKTVVCPSNRNTEPSTFGLFAKTQTSFDKYRVGKLSDPSTTTSYLATSSDAFSLEKRHVCNSISICGLMSCKRSLADSSLSRPISFVP